MFRKTVEDIIAYMDFLRTEGYEVSLLCIDEVFKPCQGYFAAYAFPFWMVCSHFLVENDTDTGCPYGDTGIGEPVYVKLCEAGAGAFVIPVAYREQMIACLYLADIGDGEKEAAVFRSAVNGMTRPLIYMLERLYEQCRERNEYTPAISAYHRGLRFIQEHYTEDISVADVAKSVGYSVSYFGYIFKKNHTISVNRYIQELRLAKAAELLCSTSLSVSDVVEKVGFGDITYFSTVFKTVYGVSPRTYRAKR